MYSWRIKYTIFAYDFETYIHKKKFFLGFVHNTNNNKLLYKIYEKKECYV
jgi:hypothetical protein